MFGNSPKYRGDSTHVFGNGMFRVAKGWFPLWTGHGPGWVVTS